MDYLKEKTISSSLLYEGSLLTLHKDKVLLPSNRTSHREYVSHPGAVIIVPILCDKKTVLIRQYRYALKQVFIEVVAGKIDKGESIDRAAERELLEETGYFAKKLIKIGTFYPCIGYSTEEMHLFIAKELSLKEQQADIDEFIEPFEIPLDEAISLVNEGKISDMKTMLSLHLVKNYITL